MDNKRIFTIGLLGAMAVTLGAMAAHCLKLKVMDGTLTSEQLEGFEKGVKYQMYHVLAMLLMLILHQQRSSKYFIYAYNLFLSGIILFSGSLYFLCTRNLFGAEWLKFLGPVTPLGGICFIAGWICLCLPLLKSDKTNA